MVAKRQIKENKLMSHFLPELSKVKDRSGPEVTIGNVENGKLHRRNIAHIKRIPVNWNPLIGDAEVSVSVSKKHCQQQASDQHQQHQDQHQQRRSERLCIIPARYKN